MDWFVRKSMPQGLLCEAWYANTLNFHIQQHSRHHLVAQTTTPAWLKHPEPPGAAPRRPPGAPRGSDR